MTILSEQSIEILKKYFAETVDQFTLSFHLAGNHQIVVTNEFVKIKFITEPYGTSLIVLLTEINSGYEYTLNQVSEAKKISGQKILSDSELAAYLKIHSEFEKKIFSVIYTLKKYSPELFRGDFSCLASSTPGYLMNMISHQFNSGEEILDIKIDPQNTITLSKKSADLQWILRKTTLREIPPLSEIIDKLPPKFRNSLI